MAARKKAKAQGQPVIQSFETAMIAATLLGPSIQGSATLDLMDNSLDPKFKQAIRRAVAMVRESMAPEFTTLEAYQLFKEDELLSIGSISERFAQFEWEGFSTNSVKTLFESIYQEVTSRIADAHDRANSGTGQTDEIEAAARKKFEVSVRRLIKSYAGDPHLVLATKALQCSLVIFSNGSYEREVRRGEHEPHKLQFEAAALKRLLKLAFTKNAIDALQTGEKVKGTPKYRPYCLFLFAVQEMDDLHKLTKQTTLPYQNIGPSVDHDLKNLLLSLSPDPAELEQDWTDWLVVKTKPQKKTKENTDT